MKPTRHQTPTHVAAILAILTLAGCGSEDKATPALQAPPVLIASVTTTHRAASSAM